MAAMSKGGEVSEKEERLGMQRKSEIFERNELIYKEPVRNI